MRTPKKTRKEGISILESFKTIFSKRNLGKEAAIEHIKNNSGKKKA